MLNQTIKLILAASHAGPLVARFQPHAITPTALWLPGAAGID
jgi:hypothetical protein